MGDGIISANGTTFRSLPKFRGHGDSPGNGQIIRDSSTWRKQFQQVGGNRYDVGTTREI